MTLPFNYPAGRLLRGTTALSLPPCTTYRNRVRWLPVFRLTMSGSQAFGDTFEDLTTTGLLNSVILESSVSRTPNRRCVREREFASLWYS